MSKHENENPKYPAKKRKKFEAFLFWCLCFIGICGAHRFYTGRVWTGLLWFFTLGFLYIGQIIDLFLIPRFCRNPKQVSDDGDGWFDMFLYAGDDGDGWLGGGDDWGD